MKYPHVIAMTVMQLLCISAADAASMLRIGCEDEAAGAEVTVNGQIKGECPLDVRVPAGSLQIRASKSVNAEIERVFLKEIRIGDDVVQRVNVLLGPPQFTAEGQRLEDERIRREQAEAARLAEEKYRQAEARQRAMLEAAQQRQGKVVATMALFREQGVTPGDGKSFRDCPDCPEMVWIPSGDYPKRESTYPFRIWLNEVTIAHPLAVGKFEITYDEFDACVSAGGCRRRPKESSAYAGNAVFNNAVPNWGRVRMPVVSVSLDDAKEYVAWLSNRTGQSYRLPSLAEYTYAARAGASTSFPWGSQIGTNNAHCKNCRSNYDDTRTAPVGSFKPNAWGLHDMVGNAGEWVTDCLHAKLLTNPTSKPQNLADLGLDDIPLDGSAWATHCETVEGAQAMAAGGSFFQEVSSIGVTLLRASNTIEPFLGFRIVRDSPPGSPPGQASQVK